MHGSKRGPQGKRPAGTERQPPQTANRRSAKHEHLPYASKSFSPEEDPAQQGGPPSSPEVIKKSSSIQGASGSRGGRAARSEDLEATSLESQQGKQVRHGRQQTRGE